MEPKLTPVRLVEIIKELRMRKGFEIQESVERETQGVERESIV